MRAFNNFGCSLHGGQREAILSDIIPIAVKLRSRLRLNAITRQENAIFVNMFSESINQLSILHKACAVVFLMLLQIEFLSLYNEIRWVTRKDIRTIFDGTYY